MDIWSGNHPFFKGSSNVTLVDEGSVNRFKRRYAGLDSLSDMSKIKTGGIVRNFLRSSCMHEANQRAGAVGTRGAWASEMLNFKLMRGLQRAMSCCPVSTQTRILASVSKFVDWWRNLQAATKQWICQPSRRARARRRARSERMSACLIYSEICPLKHFWLLRDIH